MVPPNQTRRISYILCGILRDETLGDDRHGLRNGAQQYDAWLTGGGAQGSLSQKGEALFQQLGCVTCHEAEADRQGRCPNLHGIFGRPQQLTTGQTVTVDPEYIRESILNPDAKIVAGYQNIMPTFKGLVTEDGIQQLVEYIKSIGPTGGASGVATTNSQASTPTAAGVTSANQPGTTAQQKTNPNAGMAPSNRWKKSFRGIMQTETTVKREPVNYLNVDHTLKSWLLTEDHKRICLLYLIVVTIFFFIGGAFAALIRLELATPAGDLVESNVYNKLFTMHGIIMVFFFLIPSIPGTLGNFLIPPMIGAKDVAFPKLNLMSWYLYVIGGGLTLYAIILGGVDTGWTFYVPFSTGYANGYVTLTAVGIFINGFSSILTGLNFIVTIHRMRAPGMTWFRLPLFIWSLYATSLIQVLGDAR